MPVLVYFPVAIGVAVGGSAIAVTAGGGMFVRGYVIYGLIAIFLVLIPNALAFWCAADVPFRTLYRTIANLERRWRPAAMVIVAGLVVLAIHLDFFHGRTSSSAANGVRDAATGRSHHTPDREVKSQLSETRTQILQSIQQAIDSHWHNCQTLSYIRSRIQGLLDQKTRPDGRPSFMIINLTVVNVAVMGYQLQMSAEIHDWLADLRDSDPPAAVLAGQALAALAEEGDRLGPPLVIALADRLRPDELLSALDRRYQAWLESMTVMRRRVAGVATLRKDSGAGPLIGIRPA